MFAYNTDVWSGNDRYRAIESAVCRWLTGTWSVDLAAPPRFPVGYAFGDISNYCLTGNVIAGANDNRWISIDYYRNNRYCRKSEYAYTINARFRAIGLTAVVT